MKKQEKIQLIQRGIEGTGLCRCLFAYDQHDFYCYPNAVNDKFLLAQKDDDFLLDGYCIRRMFQLKRVEIRDDTYQRIHALYGIVDQVVNPGIDISSWQHIFASLLPLDVFIEIEDAVNGQFWIGTIERVCRDKLRFRPFDADGLWAVDSLELRYSQITSVSWATRYAHYWQRYLTGTQPRA